MPVTFVNSAANGANATTVTLAEPPGLQANDVVYALCITTGNNASPFTTVPSGFTQLATSGTAGGTTSADGRCALFRAVRGGSAFTSTWGDVNNVYHEVVLVAYRGLNTTTPELVTNYDSAITQQIALNPGSVNSFGTKVVITGGMQWEGAPTQWTAPTNYTLRQGAFSAGADGMIAERTVSSWSEDPGAFSAAAFTNDAWGFTIVLNPLTGISVDSSSPARTSGSTTTQATITTASFTAPTDAILVACVTCDGSSADATTIDATVSDSGGLTWTRRVERTWTETVDGAQAAIWTALTTSSVSRTVSVARTATGGSAIIRRTSFTVYVVTGADTGGTTFDTVTANNEGTSAANSISTTSLTPGADGLLFFADSDWNSNGNFAAVGGQIQDTTAFGTELSVVSGYKSCTSGVGVTATLDAGGAGAAQHKWVTLIVRQAPQGPVLTQSHARFRNDDGSESGATYRSAEDADSRAVVDTNIRIRMQTNVGTATATPTRQIEYRESNNDPWKILE